MHRDWHNHLILTYVAVYYNNIWNSQNFPPLPDPLRNNNFFTAPVLRKRNRSTTKHSSSTLTMRLILPSSLSKAGHTMLALWLSPCLAQIWQVGDHRDLLKSTCLKLQALAATFTHLLLWNFDGLHSAWSWMTFLSIKKIYADFDWKSWRADGLQEQDTRWGHRPAL